MDRLSVYKTNRGRYSVRPIDWEGIWDKYGRIQENGLNHVAIFSDKEDAEFFVKAKEADEQDKMLILPCKPGDTVYVIEDECEFNGDCHQSRTCKSCEYRNLYVDKITATLKFIIGNIDRFGKTIFLTEPEAEKALEGMKNE